MSNYQPPDVGDVDWKAVIGRSDRWAGFDGRQAARWFEAEAYGNAAGSIAYEVSMKGAWLGLIEGGTADTWEGAWGSLVEEVAARASELAAWATFEREQGAR